MKNKKTKILWSGITGRTGTAALNATKRSDCATIVAGVCRNNNKYYNYEQLNDIKEEFDVIVDFSHSDNLDKILKFALKTKKPLIIGTAKLTELQQQALENASHIIPIFQGENFRFEVKNFIDKTIEYAKKYDQELKLIETHYKTKRIPSETAKQIKKKVLEKTGKELKIESFLEYDQPINDYRIGNLHCRTIGFDKLAEDVLSIASMMTNVKATGIYDLDKLFSEQKT